MALTDLRAAFNEDQNARVPEWDPGALVDDLSDVNGTEWDRITIAGFTLQAIASVEGDKDMRIDVKETPGLSGATTTQLGLSPTPITIRLRFLTRDALKEWADIVPIIQPIPGKPNPDPVQIYHPALAVNGIGALFLKSLGTPRIMNPGGPAEVLTRWLEFLPPKKSGVHTSLGSDSSGLAGVRKAPSLSQKQPSPSSKVAPK